MEVSNLKQSIQPLATLIKSQPIPRKAIHFFPILLAACFMGFCAQIKIPLHFTPVPLTVQTTGIMLIGAFLGTRKGIYAVLCYLIQGCIGLPVWAGGASGFLHFIGPTGGYLMAYILQVSMVGGIIKKPEAISFVNVVGTLLLSVCLQLGIGSLWLAQFVGIEKCLNLGFYPFIVSEFAKGTLTAIFMTYMKNKSIKT